MSDDPEESIFLSGRRETQSRTNLFRPKELREVVFPGVGMIMHSLFWVKHTFYLAENGYPPNEQDTILLWASGENDDTAESLLYYCIYSNMETAGGMRVNAGKRTTRDWLFAPDGKHEGDLYAQIAAGLLELAHQPTNPDIAAFVDDAFAPWFLTRCEELDIDLESELYRELGPALEITDREEQEQALVAAFCSVVGRVTRDNLSLRKGKGTQIISTTISFARQVYDVATPQQRATLANTTLEFTAEEAGALLEAVGQMENGEHFLRSLLFVLHLDPMNHSGQEIRHQMRRMYDRIVEDPDAVAETARRYHITAITDQVLDGIEETAFYWLLNFFMADGETIARDLLEECESPLAQDDVTQYFDENHSLAERYRSFLEYRDSCREYLPSLTAQLRAAEGKETIAFVESLLTGIESELTSEELLLTLLESQGTISERSEGLYLIETRPQNTNPASFYGIGPLTSWAKTLAVSVGDV